MKLNWSKAFGKFRNRLLVGGEWTSSKNRGRGTYYADMRYAPSWREYRYDALPSLNNIAIYAEDKLSMDVNRTAECRADSGNT